jgi:uncharacterized repeat protein (TIGR02543 family)
VGLFGCNNDDSTIEYTVTFDSNGGSIVNAINGIPSGATITLPANPEKGNNTFQGWFTDNDIFQDAFTADTPVTQNITVYAKWTNVFMGTWTKDDNSKLKIYVFRNEKWESKYENEYVSQGTYEILDATTIRIQVTHEYDEGIWLPEDGEDNFTGTITVSNNKVTISDGWNDINGIYTITN